VTSRGTEPHSTGETVPRVVPLHRHRDFRLYWSASLVSSAGSALTRVALPILVFGLTGSTFLTGLVAGLEALTYVLFGLLAGVLADRVQRRRIMVLADSANAVLIGSVPVAGAFHHLSATHVLVVAALSGVATVFFDAADFAALPLLVGTDRLTTATSALFGPSTVIGIIAPGIAALLFKVLSVPSVLALDAFSFIASALMLRALHTALTGARGGTAPASTWRDLLVGLRFVWRHPTIRPMTLMNTAFSASGGAIVGQFAPIASALLGRAQEKSGTSLEFLAWGVGGFLASLTLPWLSKRLTGPWIALAGTPVATVLLVLCAVVWRFPWLLGLLVCWGLAYAVVATNNIIFRQSRTPEPLLSRVNASGRVLAWGLGAAVGALTGGALAGVLGVRSAVLVAAAFAALSVAIGWLSPLRREAVSGVLHSTA
jgi:MFS family permease